MRPSLIHAQRVSIALLERGSANKDSELIEPVQGLVRATITIKAQVNYGSPAKVELINSVAFAEATGYLVAFDDETTADILPGDRIVDINGVAVAFKVGQRVPQGFYTEQSTLLYLPFFEG